MPTLEQSHEYEIVLQHALALLAETNEIEQPSPPYQKIKCNRISQHETLVEKFSQLMFQGHGKGQTVGTDSPERRDKVGELARKMSRVAVAGPGKARKSQQSPI
jgi:hypothetical protein